MWAPSQSENLNASPAHLRCFKELFPGIVVFLFALRIVWHIVSLQSTHLEMLVTFCCGHIVSAFFLPSIQVSSHCQANVWPQPVTPAYTTTTTGRGHSPFGQRISILVHIYVGDAPSAKAISQKQPFVFTSEFIPSPPPFFCFPFLFASELASWMSAPEKLLDHTLNIFKHVLWSRSFFPHDRNSGVIRFVVKIRNINPLPCTKWA